MKPPIIIQLSDNSNGTVRILHGVIDENVIVKEGEVTTVHLCKVGRFTDPRYGEFELTLSMFHQMVANFDARVFGQDVQGDVAHNPNTGSVGPFIRLFVQGNNLYGDIRWTKLGADKVNNDGFRYLSSEIHPNYSSNELDDNNKTKEYGPTLLGAAICTRPCIKNLKKIGEVELTESSQPSDKDVKLFLSDSLQIKLTTEITAMWEKYKAQLRLRLASLNLSSEKRKLILSQAKIILEAATNEEIGEQNYTSIISLAENMVTDVTASTSQNEPEDSNAMQLTAENVRQLFTDLQTEQQEQNEADDLKLSALTEIYHNQIDNAEGLSDKTKIKLKANSNLIHLSMTNKQVIKLAENQISYGNQIEINNQFGELGLSGVSVADGIVKLADTNNGNGIIKLAEMVREGMRNTSPVGKGEILLTAESDLTYEAKVILQVYDNQHQSALLAESELLQNSLSLSSNTSNISLPRTYERTVIKEALSDLIELELVKMTVDPTSGSSVDIYYTKRNVDALFNQTETPENGEMPISSVTTDFCTAFLTAIKVKFDASNEVLHFSANSGLNWNLWAENVAAAARAMREIIAHKIANEMQRVSDSYTVNVVEDENIVDHVNSGKVFGLDQFPIVNSFTPRNIRLEPVGITENPIVLKIDNNEIERFNGTGKQAPGIYWTIVNFNLGYVAIVNELGQLKAPEAISATISYSGSTNVIKVNSDVPDGVDPDKHLNKLVKAFGKAKATLKDDRFENVDFALMSNTFNDEMTNAECFTRSGERKGNKVSSGGNLTAVKDVGCYSTNAPNIHLGDQRAILGVNTAIHYVVSKPFSLSNVNERRNNNGQLNAGKEQYAEEYSVIHCPEPSKAKFISVLYYSESARAEFM